MQSTDISTNKIKFTVDKFNYVVKFSVLKNTHKITIKCTHNEEFYCWTFMTCEIIKSDYSSNSSDNENINDENSNFLSINICPEMLFNILTAFKNNVLNKIYQINFPQDFDSNKSNLSILLTITLPLMNNFPDTKTIILEPKNINEEKKYFLKLMRQSFITQQKNNEKFEKLSGKIEKLSKELINLQMVHNGLVNYIKEKYVRLDDLVDFVNKRDIDTFHEFIEILNHKPSSD
ncbi:hypothetical protein [Acanthamoeba polyphaga mimivirus]|uniref:Uncharacterized protein n=1 Tax=Acanthamoeba polyphaga mimivirus TaxID=212035 RepID=A0A0G2Y4Z6_MIMIV|nr:hypothetical protein [Acanthamoeba polyphaga mimivirus]